MPKGQIEEDRDLFDEARREFEEETGIVPPAQPDQYIELGSIAKKSGRTVHAWAFESDFEGEITSNTFEMEWPPHSGKMQSFVEMDRAEFFDLETARKKLNIHLTPFLDRLITALEN